MGFVNRVLELSSDKFREKNLVIIKDTLSKCNYPEDWISKLLREHEEKKSSNIPRIIITNTEARYRSMIYIRGLSQQLGKMFMGNVPNVKIAFKTEKTVFKLHSNMKDKIEKNDRSNLCYKIGCNECDECYIGQTGRRLGTRLAEHRRSNNIFKYKKRTKKNVLRSPSPSPTKLSPTKLTPSKTALKHHFDSTGHTFNFEEAVFFSLAM